MSDGSKCPLMTHHDSSFFKTVMESGETLDSESLFQIATEASNEHLQYDENSGMYFDKEKDMYYDPTSSIYYDYKNGTYYRICSLIHFFEYGRYLDSKNIVGGMFHMKSYALDFEMFQLQTGSKSRLHSLFQKWLTFAVQM